MRPMSEGTDRLITMLTAFDARVQAAKGGDLLVVLDAVARTGSVTAAAERLALSQPAISHARMSLFLRSIVQS